MNKAQKGFGLIEIMVSLFLSCLIMTALMQHYISTKQHYVYLQNSLEEAAALQLAIDSMRTSIQQAGFTPCLSLDELVTLDTRDGHEALTGIYIRPNPQPMLQINRMSAYFDTAISLNSATEILATFSHAYPLEHPVVISDCKHAEVHSIRDIRQTDSSQIITLNAPLAFDYEFPVYIGEWLEEQFFARREGGLFYHGRHTDALTANVRSMVPTLQNTPSGLIVHVVLGFDHAHNIEVDTRVRAS